MDILKSVTDYFELLEKEYSLFVSVHCIKPPLNSLIQRLGKYNSHYHPFCMYIKSHPELWQECLLMQERVIRKNIQNIFFGTCIFGVSEYVIPITFKGESIGFISVSGFTSAEENLQKRSEQLAKKYNLNPKELGDMARSLSPKLPNEKFVISALSHIAVTLSLYAATIPENEIGNNRTNYIFTNAIAYIHEHFTEQITVDDIAGFCKCSRSYITKLFKANGNLSIKSYITELRMQEAKRLLKNIDKSVKEIAFYLGYNDSNYFSNAFYKNIGIYPREYRRLHQTE